MPRAVEDDVHSSFAEFRTEDATCVSVQCRYCQQVRAKNTTRQRAHLLKCAAYRAAHPDAAIFHQAQAEADDAVDDSIVGVSGISHNGNGDSAGPDNSFAAQAQVQQPADFDMADHTALGFTPNPRINSTPLVPTPGSAPPMHHPRPSLDGTPAAKKQKLATGGGVRKSIGTTGAGPGTGKPEIPLADVHAAFEEFKVNPEDKTVSARCRYCNNTRAKNTSRQRDHLMTCAGYQDILRERIPANHLRYQFDEHDVASSLALPVPSLSLDFRLSIRVKPTLHLGESKFGDKAWVSCVGGQWAGRWGKGVVLPGGQDEQNAVSETATSVKAKYLLQTGDDSPALIICNVEGWLTGEKEVMERLQDPVKADNVPANRYKFRVTMQLETSDERHQEMSTGVWAGSGSRRGAEIVYDFYRIN